MNKPTIPHCLAWTADALPRRIISPFGQPYSFLPPVDPMRFATGPTNAPFDLSGHMLRLCESIVARVSDLGHIDLNRCVVTATRARTGRNVGLYARVTPMKFHNGAEVQRIRRTIYQVQRFFVDGKEILYIITFCVPRFLDLDFDEKFVTILHELFHIGAKFDGDLRRHEGRFYVHSHSKTEYDRNMAGLARNYLASRPDENLYAFLRLNFAQLMQKHGSVSALNLPKPKLIPIG